MNPHFIYDQRFLRLYQPTALEWSVFLQPAPWPENPNPVPSLPNDLWLQILQHILNQTCVPSIALKLVCHKWSNFPLTERYLDKGLDLYVVSQVVDNTHSDSYFVMNILQNERIVFYPHIRDLILRWGPLTMNALQKTSSLSRLPYYHFSESPLLSCPTSSLYYSIYDSTYEQLLNNIFLIFRIDKENQILIEIPILKKNNENEDEYFCESFLFENEKFEEIKSSRNPNDLIQKILLKLIEKGKWEIKPLLNPIDNGDFLGGIMW